LPPSQKQSSPHHHRCRRCGLVGCPQALEDQHHVCAVCRGGELGRGITELWDQVDERLAVVPRLHLRDELAQKRARLGLDRRRGVGEASLVLLRSLGRARHTPHAISLVAESASARGPSGRAGSQTKRHNNGNNSDHCLRFVGRSASSISTSDWRGSARNRRPSVGQHHRSPSPRHQGAWRCSPRAPALHYRGRPTWSRPPGYCPRRCSVSKLRPARPYRRTAMAARLNQPSAVASHDGHGRHRGSRQCKGHKRIPANANGHARGQHPVPIETDLGQENGRA
jgi:hypothetical protein